MPVREVLHPVALKPCRRKKTDHHPWRVRLSWALLSLCAGLLLQPPLSAKVSAAAVLDPGYLPALAAADRFLQAWQNGDVESGMVLLTNHAKEAANTEVIEQFFSKPESRAYEIGRGKALRHGRYEFPVVMVTGNSKKNVRRRFSSIVIVDTGHNDWAVDKLP